MEWCIFGILATITDSALLLIQTIENMQLLLLKKKKKANYSITVQFRKLLIYIKNMF